MPSRSKMAPQLLGKAADALRSSTRPKTQDADDFMLRPASWGSQTMKDNYRFECLNCYSRIAPQPVLQDCRDLYLGTPFQADYVKCHQCGLVQVSTIPQDVSPYYQAYPVHQHKSVVYKWMRKLVMAPAYF